MSRANVWALYSNSCTLAILWLVCGGGSSTVTSFSLVDYRIRSLDPPAGFLTRSNLLGRLLPLYTIWFLFVDDLGHTPSVTTQDTRYVDHHYWPNQVSQSSED